MPGKECYGPSIEPKRLPKSDIVLPHVLVGDEPYPLKEYLMRPYPKKDLGEAEENFIYQLSRTRRMIECAFGIISSKWRILLKKLILIQKMQKNH